jgi:hypothetical protein
LDSRIGILERSHELGGVFRSRVFDFEKGAFETGLGQQK